MLDFDIPSLGLKIEDRQVYIKNTQLKNEIINGSFIKDWLLNLNISYLKQLERDSEHLIVGDYRLKIHPYLRRAMSTSQSINVDLIKCLCDLGKTYPNLNIGVAIDPDFIQNKDKSYFQIVQLEKSFGLHYYLPNIIKKLLRDRDIIKCLYYDGYTGLKVLISLRDETIIEFNIYEFTLNRRNNYYINRSIHALYEIDSSCYTHIDGKALLYEIKEYYPPDVEIRRRLKRKLFRVDGLIPEGFFIALSTRFFFENELISEFFNPEDIEKNLQLYIET